MKKINEMKWFITIFLIVAFIVSMSGGYIEYKNANYSGMLLFWTILYCAVFNGGLVLLVREENKNESNNS